MQFCLNFPTIHPLHSILDLSYFHYIRLSICVYLQDKNLYIPNSSPLLIMYFLLVSGCNYVFWPRNKAEPRHLFPIAHRVPFQFEVPLHPERSHVHLLSDLWLFIHPCHSIPSNLVPSLPRLHTLRTLAPIIDVSF